MLTAVVTVSSAIIVSICIICRVFGHFSHRSEWQLVKVDYKSIFDRRCAEEDYRPWQLHSQVGGRVSWVGGMESTGGR